MPHTAELQTRLARFRRVIELSQVLNSTLDLSALLEQIVSAARQITGVERSA